MEEFATSASLYFINMRSLHLTVTIGTGNGPATSSAVYTVMDTMGLKCSDSGAFSKFRNVISSGLASALFDFPAILLGHDQQSFRVRCVLLALMIFNAIEAPLPGLTLQHSQPFFKKILWSISVRDITGRGQPDSALLIALGPVGGVFYLLQ